MAKEQTKSRTGDEEGRIVHGGELPEDDGSLDNVEVAGVPAEPAAQQPSAAAPSNPNKPAPTIEERLKLMLQKRFKLPDSPNYSSPYAKPAVKTAVDCLGHGSFWIDKILCYADPGQVNQNSPIIGRLRMSSMIPFGLFQKIVAPDFGVDELDYLINTNMGASLGLQKAKQDGQISIVSGGAMNEHFPSIAEIAELNAYQFVLPNDPYILLYGGFNIPDREFFSSYFDKLAQAGEIVYDPNVYTTNSAVQYSMKLSDLRNISAMPVSLKHLVKTAMEHGTNDLEEVTAGLRSFQGSLQAINCGKQF